jgi:hypothetical protein
MVAVVLTCPFCASEDVRSYSISNGKKRYAWNNPECFHKHGTQNTAITAVNLM